MLAASSVLVVLAGADQTTSFPFFGAWADGTGNAKATLALKDTYLSGASNVPADLVRFDYQGAS